MLVLSAASVGGIGNRGSFSTKPQASRSSADTPIAIMDSELRNDDDVSFQPTVHILVRGKGRRERQLPLCKETATTLRAWLAIRGKAPAPELFLNAAGVSLTRSGFEYILAKHVAKAADRCPSLTKKRVSPHVLRHSCAMMVLQATKDLRKVSLWLGHAQMQTTEVYLKADPTEKLETIESMTHPHLRRGHFRPFDKLLASLRTPKNMPS